MVFRLLSPPEGKTKEEKPQKTNTAIYGLNRRGDRFSNMGCVYFPENMKKKNIPILIVF